MQASEENFSFEGPPFEGMPGLRAAAYRQLYKVLMRLKPWTDEQRRKQLQWQAQREQQRRWDSKNASPAANFVVTLVIYLLIVLGAVALSSRFLAFKDQDSHRVVPKQRTHRAILDS